MQPLGMAIEIELALPAVKKTALITAASKIINYTPSRKM